MGFPLFRPFALRRNGTIVVRLGTTERQVLAHVCAELRELLITPEAPKGRLTPVARPDDAEAEAEWSRFMHDELLASRLCSLDVVERTLDADELQPDELTAWMQSCNALRLVLAERLGVTDDGPSRLDADDPDASAWMVYEWLGGLVDAAVRVLSSQLPPPATPDG